MKELIFKGSRLLIYLAALSHLALSQVHIDIITKVFQPTSGIFLFLFTIFGVVTAFSSSSVKKGSRVEIFILGCVASVAMGLNYLRILFNDLQSENVLTFEDARLSIILIITTIVLYICGAILMLATGAGKDE